MREARAAFHSRLLYMTVTGATALAMLALLVVALLWPHQVAIAQSAPTGTIVHDLTADFVGVCAILTDTIVSSANGGEIRLRATVEDYFDSNEIDATQWITGASNPDSYPDEFPVVASGVLSLYGSYLR